MICLVGEQPVPNLLPIRSLMPQTVVLIMSNRTANVSENLKNLLAAKHIVIENPVDAYDLPKAQAELESFIKRNVWNPEQLIFNLTGGTKPMSLAAFCLAREMKAAVTYLQSEGGKSLLYTYDWQDGNLRLWQREEIKSLLTLDDYLRAYGRDDYFFDKTIKNDFGELFETAVFEALKIFCDETPFRNVRFKSFSHVELDLVFRIGNQVGVAEVKTGKEPNKTSIDQLNSPTHREFLGTYTKKFLILHNELGSGNKKLTEAYRISVIELKDSLIDGNLSQGDFDLLKERITKVLGS
ncbi:MAG TPA: DUF1887 family CARF protein [Pyrinomonadaceae bacterium]|nr:DUF1887 family CARF protein [Pyrinomonadaceae bacterium]